MGKGPWIILMNDNEIIDHSGAPNNLGIVAIIGRDGRFLKINNRAWDKRGVE